MSDDTISADSEIHPLVKALIENTVGPREFTVTYRFFRGPDGSETPDSILDILELKVADLSATAREALEALESPSAGDDDWVDFKWKLTAFLQLQDIFDSPLYDSFERDPLLLFQQFYFYYESLRILRESLLCGLNGFATASSALLRPFLEFSLLQNYFYRMLDQRGSFAELAQYFKTGVTPKTATIVKRGMPRDEFTAPIRFRLHSHLAGLSESTLHPYHPVHSSGQHKDKVYGHSFESLHFWYTTRLILDAALWVYYVNFPLLFHPVDVLRKFGYNGPVGMFIDEHAGFCIRRSLPPEDFAKFVEYTSAQSRTRDCLAFYANHPDIPDSAIQAMWNTDKDGPFPGLWAGYACTMARMRATKGSLALRRDDSLLDVPDETLKRLRTLEGWRKISTTQRL